MTIDNGIFIGGPSRSGTTLIQGLVCNHPRTISVTRESRYFRGLVAAYRSEKRSHKSTTFDFFDSPEALTEFHRQLAAPYMEHTLKRFGDRPDSIIVLKEPRMTRYFPEIAELYPGAKFLVIVRDLRDVIASQTTRHIKDGRSYNNKRDMRRRDIHPLQHMLQSLVDGRKPLEKKLMFIRYESLVTQPTIVMDRVWKFLGLDPITVDTNTRWATKRKRTSNAASELDGNPVSATQIGNYRTILDREVLIYLAKIRRRILRRSRLDVFSDDVAADGSNSTFSLSDIAKSDWFNLLHR